jgi:hypothetical protein
MARRIIYWISFAVLATLLSGCLMVDPVVPTVAPVATDTPGTPTLAPTISIRPSVTLPPTWTPSPTKVPAATVTLLPSDTPPPPTATYDETANAPIAATSNGNGGVILIVTEAQLNAALARHFDAAPLLNYTAAPRVTLVNGAMAVTMLIVPGNAPVGANPQTMTLLAGLDIFGGILEVRPQQLSPLDVGVTTRQVKIGQALLLQTLNDIAREASSVSGAMSYNYVSIHPDGVSLTVVPG